MVEDGRDKSEEKVRIDQLPPEVKQLSDAMIGINPNFTIENWFCLLYTSDAADDL